MVMMIVPDGSGITASASSSIAPVPTATASVRASNVFGDVAPNQRSGMVIARYTTTSATRDTPRSASNT